MVMKDYYIILGLPKGADKSRIKKAYRQIAKRLHPDVSGSGNHCRKFMEAKEAYETLADDAAREKYDRELERLRSGIKINKLYSRQSPSASSTGSRQHKPHGVPTYRGGGHHHREYWLDIAVTSEQAASGGDFTVSLPFIQPCRGCRQSDLLNRFLCPLCAGRGLTITPKDFIVTLPRDMVSGDRFRQLAYDNGFVALHLNVTVRLKSTF